MVYLGLGDHNEALNWLEQGHQERDGFNIGPIRVDPLACSAPRRSAIRSAGREDRSGTRIPRDFEMKIDNFFAELKRRNVYKSRGVLLRPTIKAVPIKWFARN